MIARGVGDELFVVKELWVSAALYDMRLYVCNLNGSILASIAPDIEHHQMASLVNVAITCWFLPNDLHPFRAKNVTYVYYNVLPYLYCWMYLIISFIAPVAIRLAFVFTRYDHRYFDVNASANYAAIQISGYLLPGSE
jgi:hypothetical protein